jgi:hypothetical protein
MRFRVSSAFVSAWLIVIAHIGCHVGNNRVQKSRLSRQLFFFRQAQTLIFAPEIDQGLDESSERLLSEGVERGTKKGIETPLHLEERKERFVYQL